MWYWLLIAVGLLYFFFFQNNKLCDKLLTIEKKKKHPPQKKCLWREEGCPLTTNNLHLHIRILFSTDSSISDVPHLILVYLVKCVGQPGKIHILCATMLLDCSALGVMTRQGCRDAAYNVFSLPSDWSNHCLCHCTGYAKILGTLSSKCL